MTRAIAEQGLGKDARLGKRCTRGPMGKGREAWWMGTKT